VNQYNITAIEVWPDNECFSAIEIVVARDVESAIEIADAIYDRLIGFDESVNIKVCGIDRARYLAERNQEVTLWS
jgi:hypothetical protein